MDPQEPDPQLLQAAALMGFGEPQKGELIDPFPEPLAPVGVPQGGAVPLAPNAPGDYDTSVIDFQPKTYDFGPNSAQTYEYDAAGNLVPVPASTSTSVSAQGYSPGKAAQIAKGPFGAKASNKTREGIEAGIRADFAPLQAEQRSADAQQLQAVGQTAFAETQRMTAQAEGQRRVEAHIRDSEAGLRAIAESGRISAQQAKNEYAMRLAAIPEVNPNALWDEAGKEGQFQMAVAAFVHNMLAVKGINTSAMDTINGAIKNKIQAQIANIERGKFVTSGFKDLYEMTVADSASRLEVEAKLQGYLLKAVEAGVAADLGKYDAAVHRAKGVQAIAQLRQAQLKNRIEVEKHIQDATQKAMDTEADLIRARLQASIAREQMQHEKDMHNLRQGDKGTNPLEGVLFDVSESGDGIAARRFLPGVEPAKQFEIREKSGAMAATVAAIRKLRDLHKEAGKQPDFIGSTRFANESTRAANIMSKYAQLSLAYAKSGKQLNANEIQHYEKMFQNPTWFTNGDNVRQLAKLQEALANEIQLAVAPHTIKITKGDPLYGVKFGRAEEFFGGEAAEGAAMGALPSNKQPETETNTELLRSPDAMRPMDNEDDEEFKAFTKPYWEDYRKSAHYNESDPIIKVGPHGQAKTKPPKAFDAVRELAEDAFHGDQSAETQLQLMANAKIGNDNQANFLKEASTYFLGRLDKARKAGHTLSAADSLGYRDQ